MEHRTPRERLCRAFREAYEQAGFTQEALSDLTGINQATLSKYARGETTPSFDAMEATDRACGQPKGHVLRLAGYVDDDLDIEAAIAVDPSFPDPEDRAMMVRFYTRMRDASVARSAG